MRCVCSHIKALHKDGVCQARIHPCGCRQFEDEKQAQKPSGYPGIEHYDGIYAGKKYQA